MWGHGYIQKSKNKNKYFNNFIISEDKKRFRPSAEKALPVRILDNKVEGVPDLSHSSDYHYQ